MPTHEGRKRLYLGPHERKARARLHHYMAEYYDSLDPDEADSKPRLRRSADSISLLDLAVRFLEWNKANKAPGTWRGYRDGLKHITRRYEGRLACELTPSDVEQVRSESVWPVILRAA